MQVVSAHVREAGTRSNKEVIVVVPRVPARAWQLMSLLAGLVVASLAPTCVAAATIEASKAGVTNVTVTLGRTSEYSIALSASRVPVGAVVFKVTNRGALPHEFKVCAHATGSIQPNGCAGNATTPNAG